MKQDRFLTGILIAIGVLAVVAVALFFARQTRQEYTPDTSPAGVIQNYVVALQKGDTQRAYTYLAADPTKPDFSVFRRELTNLRSQYADAAVEVDSTDEAGSDATVSLTVLRSSGGLFSDVFREPQTALLRKEGSDWKIVQAPYPYWSFDWYQVIPTAKPVPAP